MMLSEAIASVFIVIPVREEEDRGFRPRSSLGHWKGQAGVPVDARFPP
jgi:hypothetical protein